LCKKIITHRKLCDNSKNRQQDVCIQALVACESLGNDGNGAPVGRFARGAGISYDSVTLYFNQVKTAVLSLKDDFLEWKDAIERQPERFWMSIKFHMLLELLTEPTFTYKKISNKWRILQ
jgi:hypothetical protein